MSGEVPASNYTEADGESIVTRLRERMGDVTVLLEEVVQIPRTESGKFRPVVNNLPTEERNALERAN